MSGKKLLWSEYVLGRIKTNRNFICCCTGSTGSGKSYAMLAWAEELDPSFNIDRVVFTPKQFMELINSGKLEKGSVILFDEIGVALNSKEHMSIVNRALNFFMQTFRHRNWILLMTTPHIHFLDAGVRRLLHAHAETVGIDQRMKKSKLKIFSLSVGQYNAKIYRKYLRVLINKQLLPIQRVSFTLPSKHLQQTYEDKKSEFTTALNKRIEAQVLKLDNKELGKLKKPFLTDQQARVLEGFKAGKLGQQIAAEIGLTPNGVSVHKNALIKKGYKFIPLTEGRVCVGYRVLGGEYDN